MGGHVFSIRPLYFGHSGGGLAQRGGHLALANRVGFTFIMINGFHFMRTLALATKLLGTCELGKKMW